MSKKKDDDLGVGFKERLVAANEDPVAGLPMGSLAINVETGQLVWSKPEPSAEMKIAIMSQIILGLTHRIQGGKPQSFEIAAPKMDIQVEDTTADGGLLGDWVPAPTGPGRGGNA